MNNTLLTVALLIIAAKALVDLWIQRHYWLPQRRGPAIVDDLDESQLGLGQAPTPSPESLLMSRSIKFATEFFDELEPHLDTFIAGIAGIAEPKLTRRDQVALMLLAEITNRGGIPKIGHFDDLVRYADSVVRKLDNIPPAAAAEPEPVAAEMPVEMGGAVRGQPA